MNKRDIIEAIKCYATEIASEIEDTEYIQIHGGSKYQKEQAKLVAYDNIIKLLFGEEK